MPTQLGRLDSSKLSFLAVDNPMLPPEGGKAIPLLLDFVNFNTQSLDLLLSQQTGFISMLQTLYIDAKDTDASITVTIQGQQVIRVKGRTQGYYPILVQSMGAHMSFLFDGTGANALVPISLINTPIPGVQWVTQ